MSTQSSGAAPATHLDAPRVKLLNQAASALAVVGVGLAIAAFATDQKRFAFSYLTGFLFVTTLGLGGLFFVLLQHVTRSGWSVGPRRQMEWLSGILPFTAVLFLPIAFLARVLYAAWITPNPQADGYEFVVKKLAYLNTSFFYERAVLYFVVWIALSLYFRNKSLEQDSTGDANITSQMQKWSAPALYLFAFSLTFAMFDWIMSLRPAWYSTIFGVYVFAGSAQAALALLAIMTILLQRTGLLGNVSTVEHRHDIGKLTFGFTVFWAYIAFSQFFLIWYANIPEETIFYKVRWGNSWEPIGYAMIFGHFWIPFFVLLSRHVKRSYAGLAIGATIIICMHYVDMYWLVMPTLDPELHVTWIDVAGLLGPLGILALWLARRAARDPLYPLHDPRMPESLQLVNL